MPSPTRNNAAVSLFTRQWAVMDIRAVLVMLIPALLVLAYGLVRNFTARACSVGMVKAVSLTQNSGATLFSLGEEITFSTEETGKNNGERMVWNFGDGTEEVKGTFCKHGYKAEGQYIVTVTVNGDCQESLSIEVRDLARPETDPALLDGATLIHGEEAPQAGTPVTYTIDVAGTYEWSIENEPFPVQTANTANYVFPTPGLKTIAVRVNGDPTKIYRRRITVVPASAAPVAPDMPMPTPVQNPNMPMPVAPDNTPPPAEPEKPRTPVVADAMLKEMFVQVTKGEKDASSFGPYLCRGLKTPVQLNNEDNSTVEDWCGKSFKKKKYKIDRVIAVRDPADNNCITVIKIYFNKKTFLGLGL